MFDLQEDSDVEWKFARSLLYMDYIVEGSTLPVPLNLIHAPKAAVRALLCPCSCGSCGKEESPRPMQMDENVDQSKKRPHVRQRNNNFTNIESDGGVSFQGSLYGSRQLFRSAAYRIGDITTSAVTLHLSAQDRKHAGI